MQIVKAPENIIQTTSQKILGLINKTSGSRKRYDNMLLSLYESRQLVGREYTKDHFVDLLARKLKRKEGLILSHQTYNKIFGTNPTEIDVEILQGKFRQEDITLVPVYKRMVEGGPPIAIFMCFHHEQYVALEIYEELREVLTGKKAVDNPHSQFIKAAIKVSEELGRMNEKQGQVYRQDVYDAVQLLSGKEVYMVSMTYCIEHRIDPRSLDQMLSEAGFHVLVLMKETPSTETNENYKFYDRLLGLAISREEAGLELAKENMKILFQVCEATESGLPRAAIHTTEAQHV